MKEMAYICAQPTDKYFVWQVGLWLQSLQDLGEDDKAHVVLFNPAGREVTDQWNKLKAVYPKAKFKIYESGDISNWIKSYIPVLRPFVLSKYFAENPELTDKAVLYTDCDILITSKLDLEKYLDDDICYLSNTVSYIGADYILGKKNDVLPSKAEDFKLRDVLKDMCRFVGIPRETAIENAANSGGAQYLLKGVDGEFWNKVMTDCLVIKVYLDSINKIFFESGDKGYQSWCADMWAVLYNLWHRGKQTRVISEMDFAWSTEPIERLKHTKILHNAGVTSKDCIKVKGVSVPTFYKAMYINGANPYSDAEHLEAVATHPESIKFCTSYYAQYMLKNKDKLWTVVNS